MKNFIIKLKIMVNVLDYNKNYINFDTIREFRKMFFKFFKYLSKIHEKIVDYDIKCMEYDDYYVLIIYDVNGTILSCIFWDFDLMPSDDWQSMIEHDYRFFGCKTLDDVLKKYE